MIKFINFFVRIYVCLQELAFKNEIYRLKVTVKTLSGKEISFLTFTKACLIISSKLNNILTLHLDHLDSPFAVNLATTSNSCNNLNELDSNKFTTTIFFRRPESSPVYVFINFSEIILHTNIKCIGFLALILQHIFKRWSASEKQEKKGNRIITNLCLENM